MRKITGLYYWIKWKLFYPIYLGTCSFIDLSTRLNLETYKVFLERQGLKRRANIILLLRFTHPESYKQMRRDFMWRFLVKGER